MLGVQRCPPASRLSFEWVVGNGIGKHAVRDALQAYERAWPARLERVDRDARGPEGAEMREGLHRGPGQRVWPDRRNNNAGASIRTPIR